MENISIQECIKRSQYDKMRSNVRPDDRDSSEIKCEWKMINMQWYSIYSFTLQ